MGASAVLQVTDLRLDARFADKVLMPGFVEAHAHLMAGALWRYAYCGYFDVNGDGYDDMIVGAYGTANYSGAAYVVFGKTNNDPVNVSAIEAGVGGFAIDVGLDTTNYGAYAISSAGDFNGDGLGDIIVTHPNASFVNNGATSASAGAAYIVILIGSPDFADFSIESNTAIPLTACSGATI